MTSRWARYANPPAELRRHALVCVGAGRQEGPLPSFRDRTLAQHALVLITRGSGRFVQSDPVLRRTEVVGPALIWVQPGARHGYGSPEGWEQFWLLLSGRGLLPFESVLGASRARPVIPLATEPQGIRPLFDELREVMDAVSARDALAASGSPSACCSRWRMPPRSPARPQARGSPRASPILRPIRSRWRHVLGCSV